MDWIGEMAFGDAWAAYRGSTSDNRPHAHAAVQLASSSGETVSVSDPEGLTITGHAIAIRSGVTHSLQPGARLTVVLIEPQSNLGKHLLNRLPRVPISVLPQDIAACLIFDSPLGQTLESLHDLLCKRTLKVDARLQQAIALIATNPDIAAVAQAASQCGLSQARLRALANEQLGVPLSKLVLWKKIRMACQALQSRASLAEAAFAAGFSDQAHLTRTMGKVLGITPSTAKAILG